MRVFSKVSNKPVPLGLVVEFSTCNLDVFKGKYRNDFYMNDKGQIVWDTFQLSRSTTEPVATLVYDVVKE
jgi:hypothetical protein